MRSRDFVRRALGPRRIHSSSRFRKRSPLVLLQILARLPLGARQQVVGVISLVAGESAARELHDARRDAVQEIAVVRDEKARAGVAAQEGLQPGDALGIQVVGRLVEDQEIRLLDKRAAERDAPLFAAGEIAPPAAPAPARAGG